MPNKPGNHLNYDDRCVIEEGIEENLRATCIARRLEVSTSTVTREVKANRYGRPSRSKAIRPARKCGNYEACRHARDVCDECLQNPGRSSCKLCKMVACADLCCDFIPRVCEVLQKWPYICRCDKTRRARCDLPKFRYDARKAHEAAERRLVHSRTGISISQEELDDMLDKILPLIRNGLSPEAIWLDRSNDFPVTVRTFYSWMESGIVEVPAMYLPRKIRCRPRKKKADKRPSLRLAGRTYADFCALGPEAQARAVQMDSVVGLSKNRARILSLHFTAFAFQFYLPLEDATSRSVRQSLDMLERALGSPDAFEAIFGIVLTDRGEEFKSFEVIERSCLDPTRRRCQVFYCDPLTPGQKGACERNHAELRRILPKGRSNFDELTPRDLSLIASHINSYPRAKLNGKCPIDAARIFLPEGFLDLMGISKLHLKEILLKPSLLPHVVKQ